MGESLSGWNGDGTASKEMQAVARRYYRTVMLPESRGEVNPRTDQELSTMAEVLDALVSGNVARAGDVMAQRWKSLEHMTITGSYADARYLELVQPRGSSTLDYVDRETMARMRRADTRLGSLGDNQPTSRRTSGGPRPQSRYQNDHRQRYDRLRGRGGGSSRRDAEARPNSAERDRRTDPPHRDVRYDAGAGGRASDRRTDGRPRMVPPPRGNQAGNAPWRPGG